MTLIDTSAFYALADKSDAHHADAKAFYEANCLQMKWVTTDYLLVESWLLINRGLVIILWESPPGLDSVSSRPGDRSHSTSTPLSTSKAAANWIGR